MPYDQNDLRSQLTATRTEARPAGACFAPQYFEFLELEPDEVTALGTRTWYVRSQNCCVAYSLVQPGDSARAGPSSPTSTWCCSRSPDAAPSSRPAATGPTCGAARSWWCRPVPSEIDRSRPAARSCGCSRTGGGPARAVPQRRRLRPADPNVAPFAPWPDPPDGFGIRVYRLADIPQDPGRFGRILRCSTIMVNYFYVDDAPARSDSSCRRTTTTTSSRSRSSSAATTCTTSARPGRSNWPTGATTSTGSAPARPSPSSLRPRCTPARASATCAHQLIDVFCPPRIDFSDRPGWVLNDDEYPMP